MSVAPVHYLAAHTVGFISHYQREGEHVSSAEPFVSIEAAAEFLDVKVTWLYAKVIAKKNPVPSYKLSEVEAWARSRGSGNGRDPKNLACQSTGQREVTRNTGAKILWSALVSGKGGNDAASTRMARPGCVVAMAAAVTMRRQNAATPIRHDPHRATIFHPWGVSHSLGRFWETFSCRRDTLRWAVLHGINPDAAPAELYVPVQTLRRFPRGSRLEPSPAPQAQERRTPR